MTRREAAGTQPHEAAVILFTSVSSRVPAHALEKAGSWGEGAADFAGCALWGGALPRHCQGLAKSCEGLASRRGDELDSKGVRIIRAG